MHPPLMTIMLFSSRTLTANLTIAGNYNKYGPSRPTYMYQALLCAMRVDHAWPSFWQRASPTYCWPDYIHTACSIFLSTQPIQLPTDSGHGYSCLNN
jgi:hypothetical protein